LGYLITGQPVHTAADYPETFLNKKRTLCAMDEGSIGDKNG